MKRYTIFYFLSFFLACSLTAPAQISVKKPIKDDIDNPPIISGIPDQVAAVGKPFRAINLWDYTRELDGDEVSFSAEGGVNFIVSIDENNFLTVTPPEQYYIGSEMIIVTVQDLTTNQYFDTDTVIYSVREEDNAPVLGDIPGQSIGINGSFADIDLNDYYHEYDGDQLEWKFRILTSPGTDPNPEWTFEPVGFTDQMTITADVISNGRPADDESGVLAAFINGELRGVGYPTLVGDKYVFLISVYNNYDGDTISFRFYDTRIDKELPVLQKVVFVGEGIPANPQNIIKLEAGNIVLQKHNNFLKIFRTDPQWAGSETAEIRVEDVGTAAQLYDSVLVNFTVNEGIINPIAAPTGLGAVAEGPKINLTWTDNSNNETHFVIQRKDAQMVNEYAYTTIGTADANTTFFSDDNIEELKGYTYRIYAVNDETQSGFSNPYSLISGNFIAPATPSGLSGEPYNRRVELSWEPNSESDLAGYILYRGTVSEQEDSFAAVGKEITNYSVRGLENGTPYSFTISSYDTAGNVSLNSEPIVVTPFNHATQNQGGYESIYVNEDAAPDTLYNVADYFTDEDNDTLVYTVSSSDSSVVIPVYSENKIVLNYQPNAFGGALIDVSATDGSSIASFAFGVTVYPVNDPPVITGIPDQVFDEDSSVTIFLNQYVTDVESDTTSIFFDAYLVSEWNNANKIIRGKKENGNLVIEDNNMGITVQIDGETNVATITGDPDMYGEYNVVFVAYDSNEASSEEDTVHITVNPVNDAPVLTGQFPDANLSEDYGMYVLATNVSSFFSDVDEDELTYTASVTGTSVTALVSGDSLIINTVQDKNGLSKVVITASDGSLSASDTIDVTVYPVNDPPVISGLPEFNFNEDDSLVVYLNQYVIDVDNDTSEIGFDVNAIGVDMRLKGGVVRSNRGNSALDSGPEDLILNLEEGTNILTIKAKPDSFGIYKIQLVAYDPNEASDIDTADVTINSVNDAPVVVVAIEDSNINEDQGEILLHPDLKEVFNDVDRDVLSFSVNTAGGIINARISGDSLFVNTIQDKFGAAQLTVTASDGQYVADDSITINVLPVNDAPVITGIPDVIFNEDDSTKLFLNQYVYDVDNDTTELMFDAIVLSASSGTPVENVKKGRDNKGNLYIEVGTGDLIISIDSTTNVATLMATSDSSGSFTVQFTAYDPDESYDRDTIEVTVNPVNDAPFLKSPIADQNIMEDAGEIVVSSSLYNIFGDIDTKVLQFNAQSDGAVISARVSGDSLFIKTANDLYGSNNVVVTASDGQYTIRDTFTVNVIPVNDPPVRTLQISDKFYQEDAGTVTAVNDLKAHFSDIDGDTLTYSVSVYGHNTTAQIQNDALIINTITDKYGTDTLIVTAYDTQYQVSDTLLVNILPVNDAPVLAGMPDLSFNEDDSTSLNLNQYVYDVDNDSTQIRFTADVLTASGESLSQNVRRYTDEKGNSVIEVGTGDLLIAINNTTNVAFIKASADSNGLFAVKFTAKDDSNAVDSDTINVRVFKVNDPPYLAVPLQDAVFPEDAGTKLVNSNLKVNFMDVDFDVLSFSVNSSSGPVEAFISGDSLFVTTIQDLYGTDTLVVTAYDGQYNVSDTLLVNIYPLNDAPVLAGLPDISFSEDDSTSLSLNPFVYDVDNDTTQITFTANVISASNPALLSGIKRYKDEKGNSVIEVGTGDLIITIDQLTNTAHFKASPDSNGVFTVEFTATDDSAATDKDTMVVNVTMVNDPPYVYSPMADTTFLEDAGTMLIVSDLKQHFKDVDFDQILFSVTTHGIVNAAVTNDNLSVSTIDNLFGVDTLVITASDGQYSVNDTILVNILAVNDAPVLTGLPDITFNEDDSTTISLNNYVFDVDNDTTQIRFTANVFSASNPALLKSIKKYKNKSGYNVIEVGTGDLIIRIDSVTNIAYISSSPDSNGVFGVEFTAIDDSSAFSSDTIDVFLNAVNDPPYIFAVIPDTSFLEDAGEHLIVADLKYHFRDVDYDTLSFSIAVLDTVINAEIRNDSLFIATKPDYFGLSAIAITASDWQYSVIDTIYVNIAAVNDPPVLNDIPDISFNEDDSTHLNLNEYLFDVDNDTTQLYFTYTVERIDVPTAKVKKSAAKITDEETVINKPLVNSVNSQALIINIDSLTHKATFSSGPDSNGVFRVVFTVTDDSGAVAFDSLTVTINPVNDAPVKLAAIKDTTFLEDPGPIVMAPSIYDIFRDIDNPSLDFVVQFSEPGMQYSIIDSVFTIEPDSHFNGTRTAYIFASDGQYTVSDTFNILVRSVNDQPRVSDIPPIIMPEDTIYRFDLDQYVYDPDHDTTELVWMAEIIRNTQLENSIRKLNKKALIADEDFAVYQSDNKAMLKTAADSLIITINTSTHVATIVATLNFSGLDIPVVFTARDPLSLAGNDTTSISVIERNDPPVITGSIPQLTLNEDDSLQVLYTSFYPYISDPETPDSLLGIFATYSGNNFTITHTPLSIQLKPQPNWFGIDTIYLSVTDYIDTVTAPVRVRVNAVNDLPYFINLPDSVRFRGDSSVTIPLWDYVEDLETPDSLMLFSFNRSNDSLLISYTASNGNLRLSSLWNFGGVVRLIITARDQGNALVRDSIFVYIDKFVGVDDENIIPEVYSLSQNYPNPFNPSTVIRFGLPKEDNVELSVYNIAGEKVRTLISERRNAGVHTVTWDGRNDYGNQLPSGIYFYKMKTSAFNEVKKLIMIK